MATLKEVKKVNHLGNSIQGRIYFEARFDAEPNYDEIGEAQRQAGYHPNGYGGPWNVASESQDDGTWITKFSCSASCD